MDIQAWRSQLSEKEKALHDLAAIKLKKEMIIKDDRDSGSYFPEYSRSFVAWKAEQEKGKLDGKHT